jgi:hypothetical protein
VSETEPTTDWTTLTLDGEAIAEAWPMPEGDGVTIVFLVPRERLETDEPSLSIETLLMVANIAMESVESWRLGDDSRSGTGTAELGVPLPPPPPDDSQLTVYVQLKPPAPMEVGEVEDVSLEKWQLLDVLWKAILSLESSIDATRLNMEGLRNEMDAAFKRPLAVEEKLNALQADVAQWTKAKSRVHHALPKVREFVHRATWAQTVAERKTLEEIVKNHIEPRVPLAGVDKVRERLEHLQKDRQVLLSAGNAVQQECRGILGEIQRATASLQRNATERAKQKRSAGREKGKHF